SRPAGSTTRSSPWRRTGFDWCRRLLCNAQNATLRATAALILAPRSQAPLGNARLLLVPKLCLGTHAWKLCFVWDADGKQSFPPLRSQAELGNEEHEEQMRPSAQRQRSVSGLSERRRV